MRYYRDGGRSRKSFGGADGETKAREFAAAVEVEANAASRWMAGDGGPIRIDEALRGWLATYRSTLSRSYETTARGLIEGHLVPHFGSRSLRSLTEADAMAFADRVLDLGRSPAVIRNALSIVRRVAQLHVEAGLLQRNPFGHVGRLVARIERRQAREVREIDAWTREEVASIVALARDQRSWIYPLLVFLFHTGARRGEALGLRWEDVDLPRGVVRIRRARVHGHEVTPKSGRSREVPIGAAGPELRRVLTELAKTRLRREGVRDPWLVFLSPTGQPIEERNLSRAWAALRSEFGRLGVRPLRLHDARHTFASHALEARVSVRRLASWLGHANPETTLRIYAHVVPEEVPTTGFLATSPAPPQTSPKRA